MVILNLFKTKENKENINTFISLINNTLNNIIKLEKSLTANKNTEILLKKIYECEDSLKMINENLIFLSTPYSKEDLVSNYKKRMNKLVNSINSRTNAILVFIENTPKEDKKILKEITKEIQKTTQIVSKFSNDF